MVMYASVLFLHILAACATVAAGVWALYVVAVSQESWYRRTALAIGCIAAFEVFSGTVLAVLSPELSAAALSLHIAVYLGVCAALEALLFVRMKNISPVFPVAAVVSPVFASVCLFVAVASYGL